MPTIKDVAKTARVSTATVSAVVNDSSYVSPELRARVVLAIRELGYTPSLVARNLRSGRSQLVALVVADLTNPFYARIVTAAEAAVAAWGFSLVLFNSDEKPDTEKRILSRIKTLGCDGVVLVPVGTADAYKRKNFHFELPMVLLGRSVEDGGWDTITAGRQLSSPARVGPRP